VGREPCSVTSSLCGDEYVACSSHHSPHEENTHYQLNWKSRGHSGLGRKGKNWNITRTQIQAIQFVVCDLTNYLLITHIFF
jgi:hypothetical protein